MFGAFAINYNYITTPQRVLKGNDKLVGVLISYINCPSLLEGSLEYSLTVSSISNSINCIGKYMDYIYPGLFVVINDDGHL